MASAYYRSQYSDCSLCQCSGFDAGFIDKRLKADYWPNGWFDPDFDGIQQELEERFGLSVSEAQIKEHWDSHVAFTQGDYREWAREEMRDSAFEDPYEGGWPDDE